MRTEYAVVHESDLERVGSAPDIHALQDSVGYQTMDLGRALLFSSLSGMGLGFYESRIFYGGRAFPNQKGPVWDWYRQDRSGDEWIKLGSSDKLARWVWLTGNANSRLAWVKYFAGNFVLAYLADFIVSNTVATIIRSYGKYGELRLGFEFSVPHF